MTQRLKINEVIIVEGRYDATALATLVDGLVLTTGGFSIFTDEEQKALIKRLGRQRGLLILTDSDAAGFKIRNYVEKIASGCEIKHAYIPALPGKEGRKAAPSKEGTLGVEGVPAPLLRRALEQAGVQAAPAEAAPPITHTDLYEMGISGTRDSAQRRYSLLKRLGLPPRLSKAAMCRVFSSLYTKGELLAALEDKPVLFWDFHGTLTLPDITWFDSAMEAAKEAAPGFGLERAVLERELGATCLPWFTVADRDTRAMAGSARWWAYCQGEFEKMYRSCGMAPAQAQAAAALMREKTLQPHRYRLYPQAKQVLRQLKDRGYRSYIISNNFPELAQVMEQMGIAEFFEGVFTSGLVGYEKPRAEIYKAALQAAGNPAAAWMIGDNPTDDVQGARACGLTTVAVNGVKAGADHELEDLAGLLALLP